MTLHTVPLSWADWGLIFLIALPVFLLSEMYKWFLWNRHIRITPDPSKGKSA